MIKILLEDEIFIKIDKINFANPLRKIAYEMF